jgi:hypothetical protein
MLFFTNHQPSKFDISIILAFLISTFEKFIIDVGNLDELVILWFSFLRCFSENYQCWLWWDKSTYIISIMIQLKSNCLKFYLECWLRWSKNIYRKWVVGLTFYLKILISSQYQSCYAKKGTSYIHVTGLQLVLLYNIRENSHMMHISQCTIIWFLIISRKATIYFKVLLIFSSIFISICSNNDLRRK